VRHCGGKQKSARSLGWVLKMLSDACSDFNSEISGIVLNRISKLKADLDNYSQPPFDYVHGEISAIRRAIATFESDDIDATKLIALIRILEKVREFHDTPPSADVDDIPVFKEALAA
jgi:hypothetical protein